MVLWQKGRPTQLPGWVHVDITPLGALRGVEYDIGGVVAARGGTRSWRRRQGSCSRVVRRRCVVLWRKGRPTQLPGWVHVDITPLVALRGVEYDIGGVVAARGGTRSWRRRQGSCSRVVRRRCVVLWRKGRLTQLPGWVHVDITPLGALRGVEYDIGGVVAARGGTRSWRRRQGSCSRVVRRRCVVLWQKGRPTQLHGWVHVDITPLGALRGVEYDHRWRRGCAWWNSLVATSPRQL